MSVPPNAINWRLARMEQDMQELKDADIPSKLAVVQERLGNLQKDTAGVKRLLYGLIGIVIAGVIMLIVTQAVAL